jgi:hypothetical protein
VDSLNDLIPGFQMSNEEISKLRDQYRATMPELKGFTDEQIDLYIGMQEATKIMKEANAGKVAVVSSVVEMRMAFEKLALELGENLVPGAEWAASAALVASSIVGAVLALQTAGGVLMGLAGATNLATAATWILNAVLAVNPLGLAVLTLAAVVVGSPIWRSRPTSLPRPWRGSGAGS